MHSHLIPGIDDGAQIIDDSLGMLKSLQNLGYSRIITTPHVFGDYYPNTPGTIGRGLKTLQEAAAASGLPQKISAGAEYYLDTYFMTEVLPGGLLPLAGNKVLVEVSMAGWPRNFADALFAIQAGGYTPILAHPERYEYEADLRVFTRLKEKGIMLQMNLLAPTGYYGRGVKEAADRFLAAGLYDYCGSDAHHIRHLERAGAALAQAPALYERLAAYGFRNRELIDGADAPDL